MQSACTEAGNSGLISAMYPATAASLGRTPADLMEPLSPPGSTSSTVHLDLDLWVPRDHPQPLPVYVCTATILESSMCHLLLYKTLN